MATDSLVWDTNKAAMTSCENTQYMYFKNSFGYDAPDLVMYSIYFYHFFSKIELKKCGNRQKMLLDGCYLFS